MSPPSLLLARVLLTLLLACFPYIALDLSFPVAGRTVDAPLADWITVGIVGIFGWSVLRDRPTLPGPVGYAILVLAGAAGAMNAPSLGESLYTLVRKPIFLYVGYGVVVAELVRRLGVAGVRGPVTLAAALLALLSLYTSGDRILAGSALWPDAPLGLTNNHKTLAVAAAPLVPLLLSFGRRARPAVLLLLVAIALSWSRTSWIATAVGLAYHIVIGGRTIAARKGLVIALIAVGLAAATYGPVLMRSAVQIDALRSRHSLDKRAWTMVRDHPLVGMGPGTSTKIDLITFPDYRVNGVDAHGVVQKVASEHGVLGLFGYLLFVGAMAVRVRLHAGTWPAFVALHVNLLLSTETFTQTHWVPLAVIWGLATVRR